MALRLPIFGSSDAGLRSEDQHSWAADVIVGGAVMLGLWLIVLLGRRMGGPIGDIGTPADLSTSPWLLPYYAARSLLRMFLALAASTVFALVYGYIAARSRRAEKVLVPLLDILQSVPILGFLSVTMTFWLALVPGREFGVELASIFAIFTSQAWNMAFAFYQSMSTEPRDYDEVARMMRLTKWQRFWKLDVPNGMIPLVWNGMMSFGGGWFFLIASEAIAVNNDVYALPGIGSFVAAASARQEMTSIILAIAVMILMVVLVNFVFWRPLTAWSEKFRTGDTQTTTQRSLVLDLLRRSVIPASAAAAFAPIAGGLDRLTRPLGVTDRPLKVNYQRRKAGDIVAVVIGGALLLYGLFEMLRYLQANAGLNEFIHAIGLGFITFGRVLVLLILATLIWVPVGVWIGLNPKVTRFAQPIIQVLASFPANFLFPFAVILMVRFHIPVGIGGIALMALGAQWYILFNVVAGAAAIPGDLKEVATDLHMSTWQRWRTLYLPAVFPSWVTGAIAAAGGAWNASIIAEVVGYGDTTLVARGLGSYITEATTVGNMAQTLIGVIIMALFVVGLNRVLWRRLYKLAESRYSITY